MRMIGDETSLYSSWVTPIQKLRPGVLGGGRWRRIRIESGGGEGKTKLPSEEFDLTAHANRDELVDLVGRVKPRIVLAHGDEEARQWMASAIKSTHPALSIMQPGPGESVTV